MLFLTDFVSGGIMWWLGFIFAPRLLIAFLSLAYWEQNSTLVVLAWICALMGESAEKSGVSSRRRSENNLRFAR
jgi:hypothetical protein